MSNSDSDFYHDDPVILEHNSKKKLPSILALLLLVVGGTFFIQTTLASNVSLNAGSPIEFGQGLTATTACSGATNLTLTANSTFTNSSGAGAFYFSSVTVSNIPSSCYGVDFTISAYDNTSSTPLALFNSTSTSAVVYNNTGTFSRGIGSTGMTVVSNTGTFTATFTTPVAQSSNVFKLTIESGAHTAFYEVGDTGPGGGKVFYYLAAGFKCGSGFTTTGSPTGGLCNYLEAAPNLWNAGAADSGKIWAISGKQSTDVAEIANESSAYNDALAIGLGYKNSIEIVTQNSAGITYAAGLARAYAGGSKNDWYLPTTAELNQMCKWARGQSWSADATVCTSAGTLNSAIYGAGSAGFDGHYWSSSEYNASTAWNQAFTDGNQSGNAKSATGYKVRPVRAF